MTLGRQPFTQNRQFKVGKSGEYELDRFFARYGWSISPTTPDQERRLCLGDRVFIRHEGTFYIEYKYDMWTLRSGNIFLETISVDTSGKKGWLFTCQADYIFYAAPGHKVIMTFRPTVLRENAAYLQRTFKTVSTAPQLNVGYKTHGILVPIEYAKSKLAGRVLPFS